MEPLLSAKLKFENSIQFVLYCVRKNDITFISLSRIFLLPNLLFFRSLKDIGSTTNGFYIYLSEDECWVSSSIDESSL